MPTYFKDVLDFDIEQVSKLNPSCWFSRETMIVPYPQRCDAISFFSYDFIELGK